MNTNEEQKIIYITVREPVYIYAISEAQKKANKKYVQSEKGRTMSRKNQKAYYERKKQNAQIIKENLNV